jgi:hypothetical protein
MKAHIAVLLGNIAVGVVAHPTVGSPDRAETETMLEERAATPCTLAKLTEMLTDYSKRPATPVLLATQLINPGISDFQKARNSKTPSCFIWDSDNCTFSRDRPAGYNFIPACQRHDFGTRNYKKKDQWNYVSKFRTDNQLLKDTTKVCRDLKGWDKIKIPHCLTYAGIYYAAVRQANPTILK